MIIIPEEKKCFRSSVHNCFQLCGKSDASLFTEVLEEALVGNDTEGPLCELLFFFLTAIFQAMAEEEEEVAKDQIADAETKGQILNFTAEKLKCHWN